MGDYRQHNLCQIEEFYQTSTQPGFTCSKSTIKTKEQCVKFVLQLVFLLLALNKFHSSFRCFHCWLWTNICRLGYWPKHCHFCGVLSNIWISSFSCVKIILNLLIFFQDFNFNPFMHNVVKWPNIFLKSCGVFLKYVWPFYNIVHERVKLSCLRRSSQCKKMYGTMNSYPPTNFLFKMSRLLSVKFYKSFPK